MIWLRQGVLFLHIAAAAFWVGEMAFVALVAGPAGRTLPMPDRVALLREVAGRAVPWIWTAIAVLVATGIGNLYLLHIGPRTLLSARFYRTALGWLLVAKLVAAFGMFAHAAVHDFVHARRSREIALHLAEAGPGQRADWEVADARARRGAAAIRRANLILAGIVLALAAGIGVRV